MNRPPINRPEFDGPIIDVVPVKPKQRYLRRRGWKDFIFLCVVLVLGMVAKKYLYHPLLTDYDKWKVRPHLVPHVSLAPPKAGQTGLPPCLFIVSPKAVTQPVTSGTVEDCLQLRPDGRQFDLYEVALLPSLLIPVTTDLYVPDAMPLAFTRTYVPLNNWSERFQIFLPNVYNLFLTGHRYPYTDAQWSLPDNQVVHYDRISTGTGYADAVFEDTASDPAFGSSRQNWNGFGWDLSLQDGNTYLSPEAYNCTRPQTGSLVGIFDSSGNEIRLLRAQNGDLAEIDSPGGHSIKLQYEDGKIIQAADSSGKTVGYAYDYANRPASVVYAAGNSIGYSYDSSNRLTQVQDLASGLLLDSQYDSSGLIEEIDLGADQKYQFRYSVEQPSKTLNVDITGPNGATQRVTVQVVENKSYYTVQSSNQKPDQETDRKSGEGTLPPSVPDVR